MKKKYKAEDYHVNSNKTYELNHYENEEIQNYEVVENSNNNEQPSFVKNSKKKQKNNKFDSYNAYNNSENNKYNNYSGNNYDYYNHYNKNSSKNTKYSNNNYYSNTKTKYCLEAINTHLKKQEDEQQNKNYQIPESTITSIKELTEESIECIVCSENITYLSEIWSCTKCYTIIHIKCIYDWIFKLNQSSSEQIFKYTCPHCSEVFKVERESLPIYNCFCGKFNQGKYSNDIKIPHTCGKTCGTKICEHFICFIPCHPGPHIQCKVELDVKCYCGKESKIIPCHKKANFNCNNKCGRSLKCGNHSCGYDCHEGECPGNIDQNCDLCLADSEDQMREVLQDLDILCLEAGIDLSLSNVIINLIFKGLLPCGKHYIENHNLEKFLKDILRILKISEDNLLVNIRELIPLCKVKEENSCRCGSIKNPGLCYEVNYSESMINYFNSSIYNLSLIRSEEDNNTNKIYKKIPKTMNCTKPCKTSKSCKNHQCMKLCCPMKGKKVKTHQEDPSGIHLCFEKCGKILSCGIHDCIDNCHSGQCLPCYNIIRDKPLICDCGSSILNPPYKCIQEPECEMPCLKKRNCPHQCESRCHKGNCLDCKQKITKLCICGSKLFENIVCSEEIKCLKRCNEILPCGVHFCDKICHSHQDEDINFFCSSLCNRKMACGHICKQLCHGEDECRFNECQVTTSATCSCGLHSKPFKCAYIQSKVRQKENYDNEIYIHTTKILECSDECTKKERLKKIEEAFVGLKQYSDQKHGTFIKTKPTFIDDQEEIKYYTTSYCQIKYSSSMINFAKKKAKIISQAEDMIENYLTNITSTIGKDNSTTIPNKYNTFITDKKHSQVIAAIMVNIYNLKVNKVQKSDGMYQITIVDGLSARLPRWKLSYLGLLFIHNKFTKREYNLELEDFNSVDEFKSYEERYKIYHPFERSFVIKNYRNNVSMQDIEDFLVKNKLVDSEDDFYLDEYEQKCFIHFYEADKCQKAYEKNAAYVSQFNDCFILDPYSSIQAQKKSLTIYDESSRPSFLSKVYSYKTSSSYYELLEEQEDNCKFKLNDRKINKDKGTTVDDDGFLKVIGKKKK